LWRERWRGCNYLGKQKGREAPFLFGLKGAGLLEERGDNTVNVHLLDSGCISKQETNEHTIASQVYLP
jgi:hypothetical protein